MLILPRQTKGDWNMTFQIRRLALFSLLSAFSLSALATPADDQKNYQNYFKGKFPNIELQDFGNGIYALDENLRMQWESMEEFAPYELSIETGEQLFNTAFKNGKTYASCFKKSSKGISQNYPYFDNKRGEIITLPVAINDCRKKNGEEPLKYKKGKMADLMSYMTFVSRGNKINIKVNGTAATEAYEKGKQFYYARRGQLNMACAHCHVDNSGMRIRGNVLSTGLGQTTHFPVYRSKWGSVGTLHRRIAGCNKQVRAKPFKAQSEEYRSLEYFMTYMNNGLEINGPGSRF